MSNLGFGLRPKLSDVNWTEWERCYPDGLGASAFSSPGWQRLMLDQVGQDVELKTLVGETGSRRFSLPVYVRKWRYRRVELVTQPTAYFVLPVESEEADASCIPAVVTAARSPLTLHFKWWLPPWLSGDRSLTTADVDTYVMELDGNADEYLQRSVRRRFLEYVRTSHKRGIEVIEKPSAVLIDEYVALYLKTHEERSWCGAKYSPAFFHGVANSLDEAGRLVLLRHNGRLVGGGVVLFDRYAVHYFQGAVDRENSAVKPHMVLYDWLVRTAAARGLRYVNLGGINVGNESLAEFKRGWGAKPLPIPHISWTLNRRSIADSLGLSKFRDWASNGQRSEASGVQ